MVPWSMTQQPVLEETCFYLQYSNLGGAGSTCAQSPVLPQDAALPLLPTRLYTKTPKLEVPHSLSEFKPAAQAILQSLWKVPRLPSSCSNSLLQDLGYDVVIIFHVIIVQESTGSWWSPGKAQVPRVQRESRFARQQVSVLQGRVLDGFWVSWSEHD